MRPVNAKALAEIVGASGVAFRENAKSWIFTCPKCNKDDKLYMLKDGDRAGRFVCWVCKETEGFQGAPEYALTLLLGQSVTAIQKLLYGAVVAQAAEYLDFRLKDFYADDDEEDDDAFELELHAWPLDYFPMDHKFSEKGREYLLGRGIDLDLAMRYGLRYAPKERRVIFPIAAGGHLYGWQGRAIFDTDYSDPETGEASKIPKIKTPFGVKKEYTLMYADRIVGVDHVFVCEGPVDAIKADLCGGNVATMGKAVSQVQIGLLRNCGVKKIYLGLDPDAAQEVMRLTREFSDMETYFVAPKDGDLGAMTCQQVLELFQAAPRVNAGNLFTYVERDTDLLLKRRAREEARRKVLASRGFAGRA
jgi:DNA primase